MGDAFAYALGVGVGDKVTLTQAEWRPHGAGHGAADEDLHDLGHLSCRQRAVRPVCGVPADRGVETPVRLRRRLSAGSACDWLIRMRPTTSSGSCETEERYVMQSWIQRNGTYVTALVVERNVMRLILFIVVVITALNIITGVLMLVKNKARDIAILRTIGATRAGVVRIFMMSGTVLGMAGVGTGVLLGVLCAIFIAPIQHFLEFVTNTKLFPPDIYQLDALPAKLEWARGCVRWRRGVRRHAADVDHSVAVGGAAQSCRSAQVRMMTDASLPGTPVLSLKDVERHYKSGDRMLHVLRGVDLDLRPGEMTGLIGPSGSGKSTLLHVAGLLEKPDAGEVLFNGKDALTMSDDARTMARRLQLGFVYQFHHLLPELNAVDNVAAPLMINGMSRGKARKRGQELLRQMGLNERDHHRPGQLSGGEQQRVAIARSLANRPKVLIADEPTGNLDPNTSRVVFQNLFDIAKQEGVAVLVATHNVELTSVMDRVLTLHEGHLEPAPAKAD